MQALRYSINVTLDGSCDHRVGRPDAQLHQHAAENLAAADGLIMGRFTYQLMEDAWRADDVTPDWMEPWMVPFAQTIDGMKKYVASRTLHRVDWNAELLHGDLVAAVSALKQQPGRGLALGGVQVPLILAEAGLIDEYEFIVQPRVAGHGPYLLAGLSRVVELVPVGRRDFACGAVALRYTPTR
jgi:dihydrofolate reductase